MMKIINLFIDYMCNNEINEEYYEELYEYYNFKKDVIYDKA